MNRKTRRGLYKATSSKLGGNSKVDKAVKAVQAENAKVVDFFAENVYKIIGKEEYIAVELLHRMRETVVSSYAKGMHSKSIGVQKLLNSSINTLINISTVEGLDFVDISDLRRAHAIVKASALMPVELTPENITKA